MSSRLRLRFKAIADALFGTVLLFVSVNLQILRSQFEAWATMVNLYIAIFGAVFLIQSYLIAKQNPAADSK
jgi:hypothetical protein